jgi:hypothetical protein
MLAGKSGYVPEAYDDDDDDDDGDGDDKVNFLE